MRRFALVLIAAAAGPLCACAVGPNYAPPNTPPGAAVPFVSASAASTADQPLPANWWRLYDDPVLDRLVQEALTKNEDLKVAAANLAYAQALLGESRVGLLPSTELSAGADYGRSRPLAPGPRPKAGWSYQAGFTASYEVDLLGRVRRTIEASRGNAQAVQAAEDAVRVTVAAGTAQAYADACGFGEELDSARQSQAVAQQTYDLVLVQRNAGAVSDFDLARAATTLEQAKAAVPAIDGQRRNALFELAALLGRTPSQVPPEAEACKTPPRIAVALPVGDGAALLKRRPDVRQADRQLAAATARIGVATAGLYPQVTLGGSITDTAATTQGLTSPAAVAFSVGPLISWSFPNIGLARAHIRESQAQASGALAGFDSTVLQALKEAEQALTSYNAELARHGALAAADRQAAEAFRLAKVQYDAGSASFLDLLTAQAAYIQAEQALAGSDLSLAQDQVAVFKALGGGWENAPPVAPPPAPR